MRNIKLSLIAAAAIAALSVSAAQAEIKISTAGPMTGPYASFGEQMKRGAEMAVADLNKAGGVLGQQVTLLIGDDACDPKQAVAVANKFISDGVVFVAGHFCSGSSIPASAVYAEEGILQISPASTNPALTEAAHANGWNNVHRVCGRDDAQGIVAGKFLASKYAGKKVAILHDKTAYGKGLADETKKNMNAAGLTETMYEAYTAGEKDYSALVSTRDRLLPAHRGLRGEVRSGGQDPRWLLQTRRSSRGPRSTRVPLHRPLDPAAVRGRIQRRDAGHGDGVVCG